MTTEVAYVFGPYRLDRVLRRGDETVALTPKAIGVLRALVARAGDLVTKDELLSAVWPGVIVTDAALTVCVAELRKALGDDARQAHFIATMHRRGYRFAAVVRMLTVGEFERQASDSNSPRPLAADDDSSGDVLVGRSPEMAALRQALDRASHGTRNMVFVSGEAGIGKTAIVETLMRDLRRHAGVWLARGQCIEHYGAAEAYMPLLDSLSRLCRGTRGATLRRHLVQYAPLWLSQMPGLVDTTELASLAGRITHATPERMLRELTELVESVASAELFVLCLEDLHWSDHATLDWLAFIARRREPARLLVIATYRAAEVSGAAHPLAALTRELKLHRLCTEIFPSPLTVEAVGQYLARRSPSEFGAARRTDPAPVMVSSVAGLAGLIQHRTGGNPLFMVHLVDDLDARGLLREAPDGRFHSVTKAELAGIPSGVKQMVCEQLERLPLKQRALLDAASVAGASFSTATIAAGLALQIDEVEILCEAVARRTQLLYADGLAEWPDGTIASRYSFKHQLYREAAYERIPAGRAVELHRRIGAREWQAYGPRAIEIAAALALHHERGRDCLAASKLYLLAAQNATQLGAYPEATAHLHHGLALLESQPITDLNARWLQELALQLALGATLIATHGSATVAVAACYERAAALAGQLERPADAFAAAFGLRASALARGELQRAHSLGEGLLALATASSDPGLALEAHLAFANTSFQMGALVAAREHLEAAMARYDSNRHRAHAEVYGLEPGMFCLSLMALVLELHGEPHAARKMSDRALALARNLDHAYSVATAANFAAWLHQLRENPLATEAYATEATNVATRHGFTSAAALALIRRGWSLSARGQHAEGLAELQAGLASWRQIGSVLGRPHFLGLLAEAHGHGGHPAAGLVTVTEAIQECERTGERWLAPDLHRLRGNLTLAATGDARQARAEFTQAVEVANAQGSVLFEGRARSALAALGGTTPDA